MSQRSYRAGGLARSQAAGSRDTLEAIWNRQLAEAANPMWRPRYPGTRHHLALERFSRLYPQLCALPRHVRRRLQRRLGTSLAGVAIVLAMSGLPLAMAATITVNTDVPGIHPDGMCSLVEAIVNANDDVLTHADCTAGSGPDIIHMPPGSVHTLTSPYAGGSNGLPIINGEIIIEGNGSTIQRDESAPDFRIIENMGELTLNNTTISGGKSGSGSAIFTPLSSYQLTLNHTVVRDNTPTYGSDGSAIFIYAGSLAINESTISGNSSGGVAVWYSRLNMNNSVVSANADYGVTTNYAALDIRNSTFSGNQGPGIVVSESSAVVENSTISGNSSAWCGGGIGTFLGDLTLRNSTVTGNSSSSYGGGICRGDFSDYTVEISDSIISGNVAVDGGSEIFNSYGADAVKLNDNNVLGHTGITRAEAFSGTPPPIPGPTDIVATSDGTDPTALSDILETTLKNNGGGTETHALVADSPAIDAASSDCPPPATDQRGVTRPVASACDVGAFEYGGGIFKPAKPVLILPNGTITDDTPSYIWNADIHATRYKLRVDDSSGNRKILQWHTAEEAGCVGKTETCKLTPSHQVASGKAGWQIRGGNDLGVGPWSDPMAFTVEGDGGGGDGVDSGDSGDSGDSSDSSDSGNSVGSGLSGGDDNGGGSFNPLMLALLLFPRLFRRFRHN